MLAWRQAEAVDDLYGNDPTGKAFPEMKEVLQVRVVDALGSSAIQVCALLSLPVRYVASSKLCTSGQPCCVADWGAAVPARTVLPSCAPPAGVPPLHVQDRCACLRRCLCHMTLWRADRWTDR